MWFQKEKNKCYAKQTSKQSTSKTEKNYLSKREKQKMWTEQSFWYQGHVQSERDSPTTGKTVSKNTEHRTMRFTFIYVTSLSLVSTLRQFGIILNKL